MQQQKKYHPNFHHCQTMIWSKIYVTLMFCLAFYSVFVLTFCAPCLLTVFFGCNFHVAILIYRYYFVCSFICLFFFLSFVLANIQQFFLSSFSHLPCYGDCLLRETDAPLHVDKWEKREKKTNRIIFLRVRACV